MAFASRFRRIIEIGSSCSIIQSQLASIRFSSTLRNTPKLFVRGLSRVTTDEKLKEAFTPHGQLLDAEVKTDSASGKSERCAFVTYATLEEAETAREKMDGTFLDGWVIFVDHEKVKPWEPRPPP